MRLLPATARSAEPSLLKSPTVIPTKPSPLGSVYSFGAAYVPSPVESRTLNSPTPPVCTAKTLDTRSSRPSLLKSAVAVTYGKSPSGKVTVFCEKLTVAAGNVLGNKTRVVASRERWTLGNRKRG